MQEGLRLVRSLCALVATNDFSIIESLAKTVVCRNDFKKYQLNSSWGVP
jgi:hypothetical protein